MSKKQQKKRRTAVHRVGPNVTLTGPKNPPRPQAAVTSGQDSSSPAARQNDKPDAPLSQKAATVAACLIVKDEEANIGRCMASLQGKVDEIVVVDTGSSDRTVEIAAEAGARVVPFEWCDDFAAARNFSVEQSSSDWVVWIDADEELMEETPGALRKLCQNAQVQRGYLLDCRNLSNEQGDVGTIIRQWRLFRTHAGLHFEGRIHEHLIPADGNKQVELAEQGQVWVRHWGYIPKPDVMKRKRERNFALLKRALEEEPDDAFFQYNLGKQYTAERQYEPGLQALERAIDLWFEQGQVPFAYTGNMFALAINAAVEQEQNDRALEIEARIPPSFRGSDVMFQAGVACMRLKRYDEAIARLNLAWQRPTGGQSIESDPSLSTWRPLGALANLYMEIGNPTEAYACAQRAYQFAPDRPNVLYALAFISAHLGNLDEALRWARQLLAGRIDEGFKAQARRIILNIGRGTNQPRLVVEALDGPVQGVTDAEAEVLRTEAEVVLHSERPAESGLGAPDSSLDAQNDKTTLVPQADQPKLAVQAGKKPATKRRRRATGPLLSIVIPAYRAEMLSRCLESTRSITADCEIVVVDDASPEDLRPVVDEYATTDKRVRFLRNEANLGIPANFNRCIEEARGQYVCILGDDDQFLPGNFEKKLAILEDNPDVGYVYSRWNGLDENGQVVFAGAALHTKQSYVGGRREYHDLLHGNYINLISLVFRRELFERYGGFDESIPTLCDWDMCLRWAYQTKTAFVAEPLANVLVHAASDTQQRGIKDQQFAKDKLAVWRKWLIERDPPLIIDEETWLRLAQFFNADLAHWFGSDAATIEHYRQQFNQLQQDYLRRVQDRFVSVCHSARSEESTSRNSQFPVPSSSQHPAPKLSVLVPAYNRPDMLGQCLDSLASVTSDCEIVVVDDASPTDLRPHVEPYIARDPRVRFFRNDANLGPTGNFNHAIELATGEYFCIIGDDETVLPGNFEKKLAILDAHADIGLVYSRHYYSNEKGDATELAMWPGMLHFSYVGGRDEFHDLFPWNYISLHSVVYRKELFDRHGGFDPQITECGNDWEMNIRYAFHAPTAYIDEPLLNVRVHQGATTRRLGLLDQKLATGRMQVWRKWLVDKDEPLVLDERAWAHMYGLYVRDVNFWFQGQPALVQKWLAEFQRLRQDADAAVQRHFYSAVPELAPPPAPTTQHPTPSSHDSAPSPHVILSEAKNLPGSQARHAGGQDSSSPTAPQNDNPARAPIPVLWEGGFFETHSLALVNREWAAAVLRSGQVELSLQNRQLEPLKFDPRSNPKLAPLVARVGQQLSVPAAVHIRQAWPPVLDRPAAGKWVMVQPWEYGRLPQDWVSPMRDLVDEIWAYSGIVKQMYVESGVPGEKIHIVRAGIDPLLFRPDAPAMDLPSKKAMRFLFVGGTIWRKGIDVLLEAYRRTFTRADDVCLVIKDMGQDSFYQGQGAGETIKRLQADPTAPEIMYATGSLSDDQMPGLYTACQCLVHPYRGEGFGLPVAEAMACGLAAIVTQGGSTDDFCDDSRAFLVPSTRRYITIETPTAGQAWVLEPDIEALGRQMRAVYENQTHAAEVGRRASGWVRTNLTWEQGGAKALERIKALADQPSPAAASGQHASSREAALLAAVQQLTASSSIVSTPLAQARKSQIRTPKLSIVIPAYNRPEMLRECLASLKMVTVDCEIVVYDDASPVDLTPTVEAAMKDDPRIRFVRSEHNAGIPESFNHALAAARGEYLCIMGDDDSVLPGNFEKKVALLDQNPKVDFVYSRWYRTDEANRPTLMESMWHADSSYTGGRDEFIDLLPGNYINLVTFVFRRKLFEERGGFDPQCVTYADWDLYLRYASGGTQTAFINEPLGNARYHAGTDTTKRGQAQGAFIRDRFHVWRKWLLDDSTPSIEERTWQAMARFWHHDLEGLFSNDQQAIAQHFERLNELYREYLAHKASGQAASPAPASPASPASPDAAQILAQAREAFGRGQWAAGQELLRDALSVAPDDPEVNWLLRDVRDALPPVVPSRPPASPPELSLLERLPRISIVMPVHDVPLAYFRDTLASVRAQSYPHWELCIVDDASTNVELKEFLRELPREDPRIKVDALSPGRGISGATNRALELASGEFIAFVDHDDILDPDALLFVAAGLDEQPQLDVIYSDEDKLTVDGAYEHPYFKPDWSPELLLSHMYIPHLLVMRRTLIEAVGGLRSSFDGAQDYDLALRVTERTDRIHHIREVLYHWRHVPGSKAGDEEAKPYADDAARRAVKEAMQRRGVTASIETGLYPYTYRPRPEGHEAISVSLIISSGAGDESLARCLPAIRATLPKRPVQLMVLYNGSPSTYVAGMASEPGVRIMQSSAKRADTLNTASAQSAGDVLVFLDDTVQPFGAGWLEALVESVLLPSAGAVGGRLVYPGANARIQHAGIVLGLTGTIGYIHRGMPAGGNTFYGPNRLANYSAVSLACMAVRRNLFDEVEGFDPDVPSRYLDVDFCLRLARHGHRTIYTPFATLANHTPLPWQEHEPDAASDTVVRERWASIFERDPYYNDNLPSDRENFTAWLYANYALVPRRVPPVEDNVLALSSADR